jgi:NTE family protein
MESNPGVPRRRPLLPGMARLLFGLAIALAGAASAAAEEPAEPRPRIALVLSGGGARGVAHVGVLEVLEEMHVPIDRIAGTSMGAIVGGLYAAGYSPAELDRLVRTLDWQGFVRDRPDRRRVPYRHKLDDLTYLSQWEFGISRRGLLQPTGLIAGHRLGAELQILALRAAGIRDFDLLPIPFRAVAADAASGETVVLGAGDLAQALRASMAVPGLFEPVDIDGRRLVDGGVVANLPVDAARAMGADVIIAVDLGEPLAARDRPESIGAVISQSLDVLGRREVERALSGADVVIRPAVGDRGLLSFEAAPELLRAGEEATRGVADRLRRYAVDEDGWRRYLARQRRADPELRLRTVGLEIEAALAPSVARRALRTAPGSLLDPQRLASDLDRVWELGDFDRVGFVLEPAGEGDYDLRVVGHDKPWGPNYLRTGLSLTSDLEGTSRFALLGSLTLARLDRLGGELKLDTELGEVPTFGVEIYQPVAPNRVPFVSVGAQYSERRQTLPVAGAPVEYRFRQVTTGIDLGLALGRWGEARAGIRHRRLASHAFGDRPAASPNFGSTDAGYQVGLLLDQLDRVNFPRRGFLVSTVAYEADRALGADFDYRQLDFQSVAAETHGRHSLVALVHGSSALGGTLPAQSRVQLGGLFNLSGFPQGRVSGNYGGVGALLYLYRLGRLPKFGEGVYAGVSVEAGNAWETSATASTGDLRHAWAVLFGADTLLGPLYLAHGRSSGGYDSFYLFLGRTF